MNCTKVRLAQKNSLCKPILNIRVERVECEHSCGDAFAYNNGFLKSKNVRYFTPYVNKISPLVFRGLMQLICILTVIR